MYSPDSYIHNFIVQRLSPQAIRAENADQLQ